MYREDSYPNYMICELADWAERVKLFYFQGEARRAVLYNVAKVLDGF